MALAAGTKVGLSLRRLRWRQLAGFVARGIGFLAAVFLVVATLEGLSRVLPFIWRAGRLSWAIAREGKSYLRRDELLGWTNIPDAFIPDLYGPGVGLRTNSRGFRGGAEFPERPAPGRMRLACSGDSLTFGARVKDEDTWCRQLRFLDGRLEPMNLGGVLYGLDQSYLRYARDAAPLNPSIHIAAIGDLDAQLAALDGSFLLPRPALGSRDGRLIQVRPLKSGLGPVRYLVPLLQLLDDHLILPADLGRLVSSGRSRRRSEALLLSILESFQAQARDQGGVFMVVLLPTTAALARDWDVPEADRLCAELRRRGVAVVNLVEEFRRWPLDQQHRLFGPVGSDFSPMGHELIATLLYRRLLVTPGAAAKFAVAAGQR